MATKPELEAEIERLKGVIRTQAKALEQLSSDAGVVIEFPHAPHGIERTPLRFDEDEHKCHDAIIRVVWDVVHKHGIPFNTPGAHSSGVLSFQGWTPGARFLVPTLVAEMIASLINRIGDYGDAMYSTGYSEGGNLLRELATGQCSPADYQERITRKLERVGDQVVVRKHSNKKR